MCVGLIVQLLPLVDRLGSVHQFNHIIWVAVVTPTDRPESVRNRCVIYIFGGVFVLSCCLLNLYVGVGAYDMTESDLFFFH